MRESMRFLTHLGAKGKGDWASTNITNHCQHIHDLLRIAERDHLNVYMMLTTLEEEAWGQKMHQACGVTLADLVRDVLMTGALVKIVLWDEIPGLPIMPGLIELLREGRENVKMSNFIIDVTGSTAGARILPPSMVACDTAGSHWYLFVSNPGNMFEETLNAASYFDTPDAHTQGVKLKNMIEEQSRQIFSATVRRN